METILLTGESCSIETLMRVVRREVLVDIDQSRWADIEKAASLVEQWGDEGRIMYGITTGFGPLVSTLIPPRLKTELQQNLVRSHATNVGPEFDSIYVRAAMFNRLNMWTQGVSGVRRETLELLRDFLNNGIHPIVPEWGSVGASGDLNPLSHIALALMGEGEVEYKGEKMPTAQALEKATLSPVTFTYKEGLASINGTAFMTGVACILVDRAWKLLEKAEIVTALSLEGLLVSAEGFEAFGNDLKRHPGQSKTAEMMRKYLQGSQLAWDRDNVNSKQETFQTHLKEVDDVTDVGVQMQSAYSLRAVPQVLGSIRDTLTHVTQVVENELNAVDDNPIVNAEINNVFQGANFHGQHIATVMDFLNIALVQLGMISERRINRMLDKVRSQGLSPFLGRGKSGLRMGFEGLQYIPTSLIAECRSLCHPMSTQSIPSNEENQDVVSMGLVAARKARDVMHRIEYVIGVELMSAGEALEERDEEAVSPFGKKVYEALRKEMPAYDEDVFLRPLVEHVTETLIRQDTLLDLATE